MFVVVYAVAHWSRWWVPDLGWVGWAPGGCRVIACRCRTVLVEVLREFCKAWRCPGSPWT